MAKTVIVGMSGGVDSSVAALLLKNQGYDVVGLFMHNWEETSEDGCCTAEQDYTDVRRVCSTIGIPYYTVNFSKDYYKNVFEHFLREYSLGRTPNPDVLCNKEIKFGVFREQAMKLGADYIATGHYCDVLKKDGRTFLSRASDENKDQTYFLNQVTEEQISNVLFPLAPFSDKKEVRRIAEENNLITATKKDSTGVCFIGERNFRKFLSQYLPMKEGEIRTLDEKVIGKHNGVFYYTEGQHKGFGLGGVRGSANTQPWYVIKKDVLNNVLYVNQGETPDLYSTVLTTEKFNFITEKISDGPVSVRIRHRQPLQDATVTFNKDNNATVTFATPQRAVTCGQYCVLYQGKICIGGGVICSKN